MLWLVPMIIIDFLKKEDLLRKPYLRTCHGGIWLFIIPLLLAHTFQMWTFLLHLPPPVSNFLGCLGMRSSHPTIIAGKRIHHLPSLSSSPASVNHVITAHGKTNYFKWKSTHIESSAHLTCHPQAFHSYLLHSFLIRISLVSGPYYKNTVISWLPVSTFANRPTWITKRHFSKNTT